MSLRFMIKNTATKAVKEGDSIVRYSGTSEPFYRVSDRAAYTIGVDGGGNPKTLFVTGLDESQVKFYSWCSPDEQKLLIKLIKELKPFIADYYGGMDVIENTNKHFWFLDRRVSRVVLTDQDMDIFFDTKDPLHALLYLSIMSGAFEDLIAPNKEYAETKQRQHYLALETDEAESNDDDDITRMDALGSLSELRKTADPEALFILAWCIQYDTNAYGAYTKSTSFRDLVNYHIKYIEGKLSLKKKRNTPKVFLEYTDKWNTPLTRNALYAEAYIKAGEYYNFIQKKEGKYTTPEGTVLGNSIMDAVETILKPKNSEDLEKLRDQVESKWKE